MRYVTVIMAFLGLGCSTAATPSQDAGPDLTVSDTISDTVSDLLTDVRGDDLVPDLGESDEASDADVDVEEPPVYWTAEATKLAEPLDFILVDGQPFFALGFDTDSNLHYDGVSGPGECDQATGKGYIDINVEKTHQAADAGANFAYVWGYGPKGQELVDVDPPFYGIYHGGFKTWMPEDKDVIPIVYNDYGESDLDGFQPEEVVQMKQNFADFVAREGKYTIENMPNLPPVEQVGHMAWHPTWRIIGKDTHDAPEILPTDQATQLIQTINLAIGDNYTYVENRFSWDNPGEAIMAAAVGQVGDKGEDYDLWLETKDKEHEWFFISNWMMLESLAEKKLPGTVVWNWIQGYPFSHSIAESACNGTSNDSWATGSMPTRAFMRKEITACITSGCTGIIYFGFFMLLWDQVEELYAMFRALSNPEVYDGVLVSPVLDLGYDTTYMGEPGFGGKGRAHVMVKWHEESRTAYVVISNPGFEETTIDLEFPWSLSQASLYNWDELEFADSKAIAIKNRHLHYTAPADEGIIIRVKPLENPGT